MPLKVSRGLARVMWKRRQAEAPPGAVDFALYSWLLSNEKLTRTTGWQPKYTSRETFEITMRAHGKMGAAAPAEAERPAATLAA
jgi:hypothetical protein